MLLYCVDNKVDWLLLGTESLSSQENTMSKLISEKFNAALSATRKFLAEKANEDVEFWEQAWFLQILLSLYLTGIMCIAVVHGEWNQLFYWARFLYFALLEIHILFCIGKLLGVSLEYEGESFTVKPSSQSYFWG